MLGFPSGGRVPWEGQPRGLGASEMPQPISYGYCNNAYAASLRIWNKMSRHETHAGCPHVSSLQTRRVRGRWRS